MVRNIEKWTEKIKKMEVDIRNKDDNKEVALGTSKINYMDPRISVAWCKRVRKIRRRRKLVCHLSHLLLFDSISTQNEVPIEKIFAKTLRDKFVWAMGVAPDWKFEGKDKEKSKKG